MQQAVLAWPGVTTKPGRFGSTRYLVGRRELGHVHDDGHLDLPLPRALRDELVRAGRAEPHRFVPDSGWATRQLRSDADVDDAIALLRDQYERARRTGRYDVPLDEG
jgi:hypothetical protein